MEELEVDPALFVRCRLCIENTGVYQVVPKIQEQIKYCFDIDVTSYDGLPQLICKTCKTVLTDYFGIKQSFIEKQNALKARISKNKPPETQQNDSSGSENIIKHENKKSKKKRRKIILSSDSSDENKEELIVNDEDGKAPKKHKRVSPEWQKKFVKAFVCTICKRHCKNRAKLKRHLHKHRKLVAKYGNILNKTVVVNLNRIDYGPNITSSTSNVVLDPNKVISNEGKSNYFILYSQKESNIDVDQSRLNEETEFLVDGNPAKRGGSILRQRLLSNDTVVLGEKSDSSDHENEASGKCQETECINLDDTSDSEIEFKKSEETIAPRVSDYKTIQEIISVCKTNYMRNLENQNGDSPLTAACETQLKRKILSVGRKTINKQSLSCTGILRYMEQKNLEIKWKQMFPTSNKDSYIVILTKLRGNESANDKLGWKEFPHESGNTSENTDTSHVIDISDVPLSNYVNPQTLSEDAVLYLTKNNGYDPNSKMLLNINPVANPKQLVKLKVDKPENHTNKTTPPNLYLTVDTGQLNAPSMYTVVTNNTIEPNDICMPIITSTTSLAVPPDSEKVVENTIPKTSVSVEVPKAPTTNEVQAPRIKVKPVSELMSERVLKNLTQQETINAHTGIGVWGTNSNAIPNSIENQNPSSSVTSQRKVNGHPVPPSMATESKSRTMILDTLEFPNTRTDSPFKYLQQLLFVHNLILLDSTEKAMKENGLDKCLTKFKIQFKQEIIENPIVLHLSIHCSENKFFIGVKSGLHADFIDISTLEPQWQWKVLAQVCQDSVVDKAIRTSENINQTIMKNAKNFFLLLKSIRVKEMHYQ